MKSRVHPTYKTKYHVRNWASYDRALGRTVEVLLACNVLNAMTDMGRPASYATGR